MISKTLVFLIEIYRNLSKNVPKMCRYEPSCSEYMIMAIKKNGPIIGVFEGIKRILRCNQFFEGGYDPVK